METQKSPKNHNKARILDAPTATTEEFFENVILNGMKKEVDRNIGALQIEGKEKPFFISTKIKSMDQNYNTYAVNGKIVRKAYNDPFMLGNIRVLVGDNTTTQELGTIGTVDRVDGNWSEVNSYNMRPPFEENEASIRRTLWNILDNVYTNSIGTF